MLSRNRYLDLLKGFAIFFVILGHCIQFCNGIDYCNSSSFLDNPVYKFIYSFHMPLFSLISGYFLYLTVQKYSLFMLIKRRFFQLLFPVFVIFFLYYSLIFFKHRAQFSATDYISWYFSSCYSATWFLWAAFMISIIIAVIHKYLKDNIFIYFFILIITLIVPDNAIVLYKFVFPYFLIGFLFHKYDCISSALWKKCNSFYGSFILLLSFLILLFQYSRNTYIYTTGIFVLTNFPTQLFIDIYRFLIGLIGSTCFIIYIKKIPEKYLSSMPLHLLSYSGKYTSFIYIFQYFFIFVILKSRIQYFTLNTPFDFILALIITMISLIFIHILNHWQTTSLLFLGQVSSIFPSRTS